MGWCQGGTIIQQQVISLYNEGLLTPYILDAIMKPFEETDADTAGFQANFVAKDGKGVEEIICSVIEPTKYVEALKKLPTDLWLLGMKPEERNFENSEVGYHLFDSIWRNRWKIF